MEQRTTGIPDDSPDNTVRCILRILQEEASDLGAVLKMEEHETGNISSKACISLKLNGRTFRIRLSWVRDSTLELGTLTVGHGYIEKEWKLTLRTDVVSHPAQPPFRWHVKKILTNQESSKGPPFPADRILDRPLLRSLIHEKL